MKPNNTSSEQKPVRIYGCGGHSQVVAETLRLNGYQVEDYFDDKPERAYPGINTVKDGIRNSGKNFPHKGTPFFIAIGNNRERMEISQMINNDFVTAIHPTAIISESSSVGEGTVVFAGAIVQPNTTIGKQVLVNTGASIDHDNSIGDYAHISPQVTLCGHVTVGEGTHIGANATVIPCVNIGKWCTIGAGAVILEDVPDFSTVVGNPGRVIKTASSKKKPKEFDLSIIGSGIAGSFTLWHFLNNYKAGKSLKIAVFEKHHQFHTGIPYGERSSSNTLLIKPLKFFLPEEGLVHFKAWIKQNKEVLLAKYAANSDQCGKAWLARHSEDIALDRWDELYVPRFFVGHYLTEIMQQAYKRARQIGIEIQNIRGKVIAMQPKDSSYSITTDKDFEPSYKTKKAVLALGSLPPKQLYDFKSTGTMDWPVMYIDDPYQPGVKQNINRIKSYLKTTNKERINVLILGSNASGVEQFYNLREWPEIENKISNIMVLSPKGSFPKVRNNKMQPVKEFVPNHLIALKEKISLSAKEIQRSALLDLEVAHQLNYEEVDTIAPISKHTLALIPALNKDEKEMFAAKVGVDIGRFQRELGGDYGFQVKQGLDRERLSFIKGYFRNLKQEDDGLTHFYYSQQSTDEIIKHSIAVDMIINCCGSCTLESKDNTNVLLKQLTRDGVCQTNKSEKGLKVNDRFEAAPNLYVMGPLLAGNVMTDKPIWHVEHAGRIYNFSKSLGSQLANEI